MEPLEWIYENDSRATYDEKDPNYWKYLIRYNLGDPGYYYTDNRNEDVRREHKRRQRQRQQMIKLYNKEFHNPEANLVVRSLRGIRPEDKDLILSFVGKAKSPTLRNKPCRSNRCEILFGSRRNKTKKVKRSAFGIRKSGPKKGTLKKGYRFNSRGRVVKAKTK